MTGATMCRKRGKRDAGDESKMKAVRGGDHGKN